MVQTVIDYSEKLTIKEKEVLAKGGSFALKPVVKTIDITATIKKACIQLRMLNKKRKSTSTTKPNSNDDLQVVNNPFTNSPFEMHRIIPKKDDKNFENKFSHLKHLTLEFFNKAHN